MGSKSDYLANKIMDHMLGGGDYTRPATVYVALFTVTPGEAGGGTEVTGGSYARVAVTNNATNFPASLYQGKSNATTITFPTATADWGTIVGTALFDASTAGNMLFWSALNASKVVSNGDVFRFQDDDLVFTED